MKDDSVENHVRAFGMSGLLIVQEMLRLSRETGMEFTNQLAEPGSAGGIDHFEAAVRKEAEEMAHYYQLFYCLEKSIRKLVSENLREAHGVSWWDTDCVPQQVKDEVRKRQDAEIDSGITPRSEDKLDFTTFGELEVLISKNWDVFETILDSRRAVQRVLSNLNLLRGPIAHCCPYSQDEKHRLALTVKDWLRLL